MKQQTDREHLQEVIGYQFRDQTLLEKAMTHSSYVNEHQLSKTDCNERPEFLGDAVLEIVSSEFLYFRFPQEPEGKLTRLRASIVCEPTLDYCARAFGLQNYLVLGRGEESTGGRGRASLVSDALEALIGAIYLDGVLLMQKSSYIDLSSMTWNIKNSFSIAKPSCRKWCRRRMETVI